MLPTELKTNYEKDRVFRPIYMAALLQMSVAVGCKNETSDLIILIMNEWSFHEEKTIALRPRIIVTLSIFPYSDDEKRDGGSSIPSATSVSFLVSLPHLMVLISSMHSKMIS